MVFFVAFMFFVMGLIKAREGRKVILKLTEMGEIFSSLIL